MLSKMTTSAAVVCGALLFGTGCESSADKSLGPTTPAEKTMQTSQRLERSAKVMKDGEKMIADGQSERAKGIALREQGRVIDGEGYIAKGESKIRQGQTMINEAWRYRQDALAQAERNTQASQASFKQMQQTNMDQQREVREVDHATSTAQPEQQRTTPAPAPAQQPSQSPSQP